MELKDLKKNWDEFGKQDPLWSILTDPTKKGNKWTPEEFFKTGEEEIESVLTYLNSLGVAYPRNRALDFGCGVGRLTQALCYHFNECYGIDIAPSMIELAKTYNRYGSQCKYYINDSESMNIFESNYFDFIYSKIVLQHIRPEFTKNYLKEFMRIIAPGGLLVFQVPSEPAPVESLNLLEDSAYKADIKLQEALITAKPSSKTAIQVKVKNISDITWPSFTESSGKYHIDLGNHWLNESGEVIVNDDGREPLPNNLPPMEETLLSLTITIPGEPGNYILELDMVHEQVAWFKDKGSKTTRVPIKVEEIAESKSIGSRVFNLYQRLRGVSRLEASPQTFAPSMEMYGLHKDVVLELISNNGGKVLDVQQDFSVGQGWLSFLYCVVKE